MRTTSLDILEKAQLPGNQAKAILRVMELELEDHRQTLATHADIAALRTATHADIAALRTATQADIAALRAEMAAITTELRVEIKDAKVDMIKWMITTNTVFFGLGLGVIYFFLNHLHH